MVWPGAHLELEDGFGNVTVGNVNSTTSQRHLREQPVVVW
jgi:hypothetical protein